MAIYKYIYICFIALKPPIMMGVLIYSDTNYVIKISDRNTLPYIRWLFPSLKFIKHDNNELYLKVE